MLALALVVSVGSTPVFANQSSPSQENPKDIIWVDGSKQYDENGKLLPTPTSDGKGSIQPYAGTTYRIKNQTFLWFYHQTRQLYNRQLAKNVILQIEQITYWQTLYKSGRQQHNKECRKTGFGR